MQKKVSILISFFVATILCILMVYVVLVSNNNSEAGEPASDNSSSGSVTETAAGPTPEPLSDSDVKEIYAPVLDEYENASDNDYRRLYEYQYVNTNLGESLPVPSDLSYAYYDTVDDGYPELIIADLTVEGYKIIDILGYDGSSIDHLCDYPSDQINVKLLEDGIIYEANWSGKNNRNYDQMLKILPCSNEPTNLCCLAITVSDKNKHNDHKVYYYTDGSEKETEITRAEYNVNRCSMEKISKIATDLVFHSL